MIIVNVQFENSLHIVKWTSPPSSFQILDSVMLLNALFFFLLEIKEGAELKSWALGWCGREQKRILELRWLWRYHPSGNLRNGFVFFIRQAVSGLSQLSSTCKSRASLLGMQFNTCKHAPVSLYSYFKTSWDHTAYPVLYPDFFS